MLDIITIILSLFLYITLAYIIGFTAAWLSVAFIEMTNYGAVLGWFRFWIAKQFEDADDKKARMMILNDDGNVDVIAEGLNDEYYKVIARRCKLMYLLTCKYCLGTWLNIFLIVTYAPFFALETIYQYSAFVLLCMACLYYCLNDSNKNIIIQK